MKRSAPVPAARGSRSAQNVTPPMSGPWRVCQVESPVKQVAIPADGTVGPPSNSAEYPKVRGSSAISARLSGKRFTARGR